jgi:hypothetical protein
MTYRSPLVLLLAILAAGTSLATDAHACACCSDTGQRIELTQQTDSYSRDELAAIRFAPQAKLYSDAGFPDTVSGIQDPLMDAYVVTVAKRPAEWLFEVVDAKGRKGSILFPLPKQFTRFEVDTKGLAAPLTGNGPDLYKEWRMHGITKLGGILAANGVWARARIILHGEGNACTAAPNFTSWTLSVTGKDIRFRFLGTTLR